MQIPDLTDETEATYYARLHTDPRLNALEIAILDLVLQATLDRIDRLIAHLHEPGHDPDVALACIESLTNLHDHITTDLLHVEAVIEKAAEVIP